jgi:peptide deformylase
MARRDILLVPDPRLKLVSAPVAQVDDAVRALMADMLETMYAAPGIGLAAIQIGVAQRVIVMDLAREGEPKAPKYFVNPEILWRSEETAPYEEGCLSIPDIYDEEEADGLYAVCIQHEIDHCDGVLFIDYLSRLKRDRAVAKVKKAAKAA